MSGGKFQIIKEFAILLEERATMNEISLRGSVVAGLRPRKAGGERRFSCNDMTAMQCKSVVLESDSMPQAHRTGLVC